MKIHKGDTVQIKIGKDRGKSGKVIKVNIKDSTLLVEGLNIFKRHIRPKRQGEKGQIVSLARPVQAGKVMLLCSNCKRAVRIGYRFEGENKFRQCKKCGSVI